MAERRELDGLIDAGIQRIRATWAKLGSRKLGAGPYGKQQLLEDIYTVYCGWQDCGRTNAIWERLAKDLAVESVDPAPHLLTLLITVALPEVRPNVVAIWVDAIRYGEAHHVRPFKLRGCFYVMGGLSRCAKLFREEERARQEEEEIRRLEEEERQARIKLARQEARRQRNGPKKPAGSFGLFD